MNQKEQQQQLQAFCNKQYQEIQNTSDFNNHSLPLVGIKKIMEADENVGMTATEAPVVLASACEMFILELTRRSWAHAEENKRTTLQKNDIVAAINQTDLFKFLLDSPFNPNDHHMQYYHAPLQEREMEISTEIRDWSEMIPDTLGIIFKDLSLQEKLTVVPRVCKSWRRAVHSPLIWQEIDSELLCGKSWTREKLDRLVRMLIMRSCDSLSKLEVYWLCNDALFSFLADNASSLRTLIIPGNEINDNIVEQVANRLTNVTTLDLRFSVKIGPKALEAFGKNCKNLTVLHFSSNPLPIDRKINQDDEAFAISSTMPNLRRLEVPSLLLTNDGVLEILSKCKKLELLNVEGCYKVTLEQELLKEKYPNVKVLNEQLDYISDEDFDDYLVYQYDIANDGYFDFEDDFIDAYGLF